MKGTYKFYQGGVLIATSENLVTEAGRKHIMRYLGGLVSNLGGSIAVGLGASAASTTDTTLNFEWDRAIVSLSSADFTSNKIVFKGTIAPGAVGTIYETGLYSEPSMDNGRTYDSKLLFAFGNGDIEPWQSGTYANTNNRVSPNALRVTASTSSSTTATLNGISLDLSGYSNSDIFKIAFKPTNSNVTNFNIRFVGADTSSYYEATITPVGTSYQITTFTKSNFTKIGTNVDWSNIQSTLLIVNAGSGGSGSVDFDALRVEDIDSLDSTNVLVSRSVLTTPVVKSATVPTEIEYYLDVSVV